MLYWICPECGGECSPAVRECPACAGAPAASPASAAPIPDQKTVAGDVLALVQNLSAVPVTPPPPQPVLDPVAAAGKEAGSNGHSSHRPATLELAEPLTEIHEPPRVKEEPTAPPSEALESLVRPLIESAPPPRTEKADLGEKPRPEIPASSASSPAAELRSSAPPEPVSQPSQTERAGVQGIVASFQQQPKANLLAAPEKELIAPAPPAVQWMRTPRPQLSPFRPKPVNAADLMFGVQTAPLAGPCVPQELRNLSEQSGGSNRSATRKKTVLPAWTVSFVVAITLFLGVGSLLQYLAANRDARSALAAPQTSEQPAPVAAGEPSTSTLIEVTGLRVLPASNQRPQLEFIVVNHSAAPLSDIALRIAVHSASAAGSGPLFSIATTIPSLAAYQSREFRAELDRELQVADLPDWQSLRADVRVTSQK